MCNTGNYIQYTVINHNGKEYKKIIQSIMEKNIYETESLYYISKTTNTTL